MTVWILIAQAMIVVGSPVEAQTVDGWVPGTLVGATRNAAGIEYKVSLKDGNFTVERYFPAAKVRATGGAAASAFAIGQTVDARNWNGEWRRGTVTGIEGSAEARRFRIAWADGGEGSFYADRMRAAAGAPPVRRIGPVKGGPLAYGTYACTRWLAPGRTQPPVGSITLMAGGTYRWLDDGGSGRYGYDPATGAIRFLTGPIAAKLPKSAMFQPNVRVPQIDVNFGYGVDWSCGLRR